MHYGLRLELLTTPFPDKDVSHYLGPHTAPYFPLEFSNTQIHVGGFVNYSSLGLEYPANTCNCALQYFRFFTNYATSNPDQIIALAMASSLPGNLLLFRFDSYIEVNSNLSFPVEYYMDTAQPDLTGLKGTTIRNYAFR